MKVTDLQIQHNALPIRPKKLFNSGQIVENTSKDKVINKSFSDILENKIANSKDIRFSGHAVRRLNERQIDLSQTILSRLESGVKRVEDKGARNSLILLDDTAYIVSVPNKTVVTALTKEAALNNVFTNIDSVAIV